MKLTVALLLLAFPVLASASDKETTIKVVHAAQDEALQAVPSAPIWKNARAVFLERDTYGKPVAGDRSVSCPAHTEGSRYPSGPGVRLEGVAQDPMEGPLPVCLQTSVPRHAAAGSGKPPADMHRQNRPAPRV